MDDTEMTMREALNLALDQALAADERVFLLGEDIADPGASGPTAGLSTKYGHERVLDTPISEAAIWVRPSAPPSTGCCRSPRS